MLRNTLIVVVVAVVLAVGIFFGMRSLSHSSSTTATQGTQIGISIGAATPQAAQIALGGRTYPVQSGSGGTRDGHVTLTADAGSVAVVRDAAGHVLATAPVWAVPGQPPRAAQATCASTAFDQFLLTPGVSGANPVAVDLLWSLAGQGQVKVDVAALGNLICAGLQRDPAHLAHPSQAEIAAYQKVYLDFSAELPKLAGQMPSVASSIAGIRAATGGTSPTTSTSPRSTEDGNGAVPSASAVAATSNPVAGHSGRQTTLTAERMFAGADSRCDAGFTIVATAAGSTSPLGLCSDGNHVHADSSSAAWTFLYRAPVGQNDGSGIPSLPLAIVPGQTSTFPSIGTIVGAVIHDDIVAQAKTGCSALGLIHVQLDVCKSAKKPSESAVAKLFDLVEPGEVSASAAAGYYSVAWGNGQGNRSVFPAGATTGAEENVQRYSKDLTFISSVIVPTIGLILDKQLDPDNELPPDQLPLLLPVFNELAGTALQQGVNGEPSSVSGDLRAVGDTAKTLFENPNLLQDIFVAFALPNFGQISKDATKQLIEYVASLEVPVAGWTVLLIKLVADGSSAATLALSIAAMFDALTQPSYNSWTPVLTAGAAFELPLFTPTAQYGACTVPAAHAAIPPGAPGVPSCEWVVSVDLDGNGKADRLVAWQTADLRGAVAFLDDGSVEPLQNGSAMMARSNLSWQQAGRSDLGESNQPVLVLQAMSSARQQVLLIDSFGAVGNSAEMVGLAADGGLRLVMDAQAQTQAENFLTARNFGCGSQSGKRLFVEGAEGRGEPGGATGPYPGEGISHSYYQISDDLQMQFLGYEGQIVPSLPKSDPFANDCSGTLPTIGTLYPYATSPQQALTGLLNAAVSRDKNRGAAFAGGAYADFSTAEYDPDVWTYLTATNGLDPSGWLNHPVHCTTSDDAATCIIAGPGGEPLSAEVDDSGPNWTVDGIEAG